MCYKIRRKLKKKKIDEEIKNNKSENSKVHIIKYWPSVYIDERPFLTHTGLFHAFTTFQRIDSVSFDFGHIERWKEQVEKLLKRFCEQQARVFKPWIKMKNRGMPHTRPSMLPKDSVIFCNITRDRKRRFFYILIQKTPNRSDNRTAGQRQLENVSRTKDTQKRYSQRRNGK